MALRKPLVLNAGKPEQLQAGDTLDASVNEKDVQAMTNANAGAITIGQVVYISAADNVDLAQANASATSEAWGLVADASIAASASGQIQTDGVLSGLSGLTAGATYFLDEATPGAMTTTAPATGWVVELGRAINTTDFEISIRRPIKL